LFETRAKRSGDSVEVVNRFTLFRCKVFA
jgi:hypothetical protein